jgi:hypothetical protein
MEDFLLYLVFGAIALLKLVAKAWRERRARQEPQQTFESSYQEPEQDSEDDAWWNPPAEPTPSFEPYEPPPIEAPPAPIFAPTAPTPVPRPRAADRPRPKPRAAQARKPDLAKPAVQHRIALNNPAELRRAFELMAILGPPRSLAPEDS